MNAPEPKRNVYQRLSDARAEFHTLKLKKSGHNKFAGYNYFELGDFLIPALNVFRTHGLCATISYAQDVATMTIVSMEDGGAIEITSPMAEAQLKGCHPIQNLGAVETYTRRYLWVTALEIVEHDAIDSSKPIEEEKPKVKATKISPREEAWKEMTPEQQKTLTDIAEEAMDIYGYTGEIGDAHTFIYGEHSGGRLNNDEIAGLWFILSKAKTDKGRSFTVALDKFHDSINLAGAM